MADAKDTEGENRPSSVRITVIVQNRYTFDTQMVTGKQIKETANVPAAFGLYRRVQRGNVPIPDDALVELCSGDHFFARPTSDASRHIKPATPRLNGKVELPPDRRRGVLPDARGRGDRRRACSTSD